MGKQQFPISEKRIIAIARRIKTKNILNANNSKIKVIKEITLDDNLVVRSLLDELKELYPTKILLSEVDNYIQNEESEEQLAEDLNITISELSDFKMYLYNKYSEK
jgi:hypothetical protein